MLKLCVYLQHKTEDNNIWGYSGKFISKHVAPKTPSDKVKKAL